MLIEINLKSLQLAVEIVMHYVDNAHIRFTSYFLFWVVLNVEIERQIWLAILFGPFIDLITSIDG